MKTAGVIAEYDPFHNGHLYHLKEVRRLTGAECVIAVMSGCFTQRGSVSLFTPRDRARMALKGGADLVVELPFIYACNSAGEFASGGIGILSGMGADAVSFGCENADPEELERVSEAMLDSGACGEFKRAFQSEISKGISQPEAYTAAFGSVYGSGAAEFIRQPNNLLACEYIKAIKKSGCGMGFVPVKRSDSHHNDGFSSSSAIRSAVLSGRDAEAEGLVPGSSFVFFKDIEGIRNISERISSGLFGMLKYRLAVSSGDIGEIYSAVEGIEHRLAKFADAAENFGSFIRAVKTRRYTYARVSRLLCCILVNLKKRDFYALRGTCYARILGFSDAGREYLKKCRDSIRIPVLSNLRRMEHLDESVRRTLEYDIRASKIIGLAEGRNGSGDEWKRFVPYAV